MFDLISISEAIKRSYDSEGLLVDVRSEEVFKKGHLPMAVNLPFEEIMAENGYDAIRRQVPVYYSIREG